MSLRFRREFGPALENRDGQVVAADDRKVAVRGWFTLEQAVEGRATHGDRRVCGVSSGALDDIEANAIARRDVPRARRELEDLLRDRERLAARPLRRDGERKRPIHERRLEARTRPDGIRQ